MISFFKDDSKKKEEFSACSSISYTTITSTKETLKNKPNNQIVFDKQSVISSISHSNHILDMKVRREYKYENR